ncbi:MAG TPA: DUF86 domain-containing protein [Polyangiaceae bacterium]
MVNRSLVSSKLGELAERVERIRAHDVATADELKADPDAFDVVSFNLMLAVQICADVASHLIADERWPAAKNIAESFTRLEQQGVIDAPVADALRRAAGLRNVVAHGYGGVDPVAVYEAATRGIADLDAFARAVASWLTTRR